MTASQTDRLVAWLRANNGASSIEIYNGASSIEITVALRLVNVTGRVSDARKAGYRIDAIRDDRGVHRYWLREARPLPTTFRTGDERQITINWVNAEAWINPLVPTVRDEST